MYYQNQYEMMEKKFREALDTPAEQIFDLAAPTELKKTIMTSKFYISQDKVLVEPLAAEEVRNKILESAKSDGSVQPILQILTPKNYYRGNGETTSLEEFFGKEKLSDNMAMVKKLRLFGEPNYGFVINVD